MDALLILDGRTQTVIEANEATLSMLGYGRDELEGKPFTGLYPEGKSRDAAPIKVYGSVFLEEFRKKDGSSINLDLTATMIPWNPDGAVLVSLRDASERLRAEQDREKLVRELEGAIEKIKTLRGLLPICALCKKIRDDKGYWQQVEVYVEGHSLAEFSHGICPDCLKKYYSKI
jgi:PAS domain S-box-containing protein